MATKRLARKDILSALRKHDDALRRFSVTRIGLFGSYASGRQGPGSDIDFLVEFEQPTYDNFIGLVAYLEKTFRRKVEVLTPDAVESIRVQEVAQSIRDSVVYV